MTEKQEDKTAVTREQLADLPTRIWPASIRQSLPMLSILKC
jgi:hypothetical protein